MQFAFKKCRVVLLDSVLNGVMLRIKSLDEHATRQFAAASTAGNLGHQLKSPFGGTEVRHGQRAIGTNLANQRHAMKVVAFGEHLGADQEVQRSVGKRA